MTRTPGHTSQSGGTRQLLTAGGPQVEVQRHAYPEERGALERSLHRPRPPQGQQQQRRHGGGRPSVSQRARGWAHKRAEVHAAVAATAIRMLCMSRLSTLSSVVACVQAREDRRPLLNAL